MTYFLHVYHSIEEKKGVRRKNRVLQHSEKAYRHKLTNSEDSLTSPSRRGKIEE